MSAWARRSPPGAKKIEQRLIKEDGLELAVLLIRGCTFHRHHTHHAPARRQRPDGTAPYVDSSQLLLYVLAGYGIFASAIDILKVLVIVLGAGLGVWGDINLLKGYGNDNPGANA